MPTTLDHKSKATNMEFEPVIVGTYRTNCIFTFNKGQMMVDLDLPLCSGMMAIRSLLVACSQCLRPIEIDDASLRPGTNKQAYEDRLCKVSMCADFRNEPEPDWYRQCSGKLYYNPQRSQPLVDLIASGFQGD